ncbi:DNA-binding PadR family transcriptional regulator [Nocardia sp. GAS34]|uniref:PadR family transcriptional regulator n=1 Tax=unclassified Nocardia TaxID=2637762 RepID=UPI003D211272
MAQRRTVTNPLALVVMAWLLTGPAHPYELSRRLEETRADRHVKYTRGSLYMVIGQLTRAGFIAEQGTVRDSRWPERTVYALTDAGRAEYVAWMRTLLAHPENEYPRFGVALSLLAGLPPAEAAELLATRRDALAATLAELRAEGDAARAGGLSWIFLVEDDYQVAQLETEHTFVSRLIESLSDPAYQTLWQQTRAESATQSGLD